MPASARAPREKPVPDGPWRPHLLRRCVRGDPAPAFIEQALTGCQDLFQAGEGSDAIMELELCLADHGSHGLLHLTLGQLYLMAGQGEPELLPSEGPAADVGDWSRNRQRLLARAEELLQAAVRERPDDAAVEYLLADVARARGDSVAAERSFAAGRRKCTLPRSFEILRRYQALNPYPARLLEGVAPDYPLDALQDGKTGEVVLDLLLNPDGGVSQIVPLTSPHPSLTTAAAAALQRAHFAPARIGKYPIWSWLRMPTQFSLAE